MDWDRKEDDFRAEASSESEHIDALVARDRDIYEITHGSLNESTRGGSQADTWAAGGGFGLAIGPLVLGAAGGGGGASSSAWQDSSRNTSADFLNQLRDNTVQSANSVRNQRSTVVQSVRQHESVRATTEVVANHNHCHAITIEYFEVLRHFQLQHEIADVQECLFIPLFLSQFDADKILRWRTVLSRYLTDKSLVRGFDAVERIKNFYEGSDLPLGMYCDENIDYLEGEFRLTFKLSRPEDNSDGTLNLSTWNLYAPFLWVSPSEIFNLILRGLDAAAKDRAFQSEVAPRIAESFVNQLRFFLTTDTGDIEIPMDPTLVSSYVPNAPLQVSLRANGALPAVSRKSVIRFKIETDYALPAYSKTVVNSASVRYRSKHSNQPLFQNFNVLNDLTVGDNVEIPTFLNSQELRNPREEDKELQKKLIAHLNQHIEAYHRIIWYYMDNARRYMLLDGFIAPNSNGRSVASVVENRVIGIVGNNLVMPVARGFHLDPTYSQGKGENKVDLLDLYRPNTTVPPLRLSVPTRGVYAESVMGQCNSCEEKDESRFWRWEESPIDEPPTIGTTSTDTRRSEPGNLQAKDFPNPMINIQNAPAAPEPSGLAGTLGLLGTPNLFKDITGLEGNQKNALAAFQSALEASKFFGGEAAKLESQKIMMDKMSNVRNAISQARKDGLVNDEQAKSLTGDAIRSMIGTSNQPSASDLQHVQEAVTSGVITPEEGGDLSSNIIRRMSGQTPGSTQSDTLSGLINSGTQQFNAGGIGSMTAETTNADGSAFKLALASNNSLKSIQLIDPGDFDALFSYARAHKQTPMPGMGFRKSHLSLDSNPSEWASFKNAINVLRGNGTYQQFVDTHDEALNRTDAARVNTAEDWQAHSMGMSMGMNFLTWHRAFLCAFEDALQAVDPTVTIPYWDWYNNPRIPAAMTSGIVPMPDRITPPGVGSIPSKTAVQQFWRRAINSQTTDFATIQKDIEQNLHNPVHMFVGGLMTTGMSPSDPLFWMHHCFIDKLWADYQNISFNMHGPQNLNDDLQPHALLKFKVREVINIQSIPDCAHNYEELLIMPVAPGTMPSNGSMMA